MAVAAHFLNAVSAHFHHYYSDSNDETEIKYEIKVAVAAAAPQHDATVASNNTASHSQHHLHFAALHPAQLQF